MKKPSPWCDREGWIYQVASHLAPTMFPIVGMEPTIKRFNENSHRSDAYEFNLSTTVIPAAAIPSPT